MQGGWRRGRAMRIARWALLGVVALLVTTTAAPQLLAWPYSAEIGRTIIYSERPIPPEMRAVLARSDALLARSPLAEPNMERRLFLTDGGWRWDLLALTSRGAFALRRPLRDAIIVNDANVAADRVENGAPVGGARSLSGVIAHETTHILVADQDRRMARAAAARLEERGLCRLCRPREQPQRRRLCAAPGQRRPPRRDVLLRSPPPRRRRAAPQRRQCGGDAGRRLRARSPPAHPE
jgi:hypothetical protein